MKLPLPKSQWTIYAPTASLSKCKASTRNGVGSSVFPGWRRLSRGGRCRCAPTATHTPLGASSCPKNAQLNGKCSNFYTRNIFFHKSGTNLSAGGTAGLPVSRAPHSTSSDAGVLCDWLDSQMFAKSVRHHCARFHVQALNCSSFVAFATAHRAL